jgi:hypothetical protein
MIGESLSLCIDEPSQVVGVTNPDGNIVTFWDLLGKKFVKRLDLPRPAASRSRSTRSTWS